MTHTHTHSDPNLGLLRDDYTLVCEPMDAFTSIYAVVFVVLYPLGIPVFLNLACRFMHITSIVKEKMDSAKVEAMLALFMRRGCSAQTHRVARLVGNTDSDPEEFDRQSELEFRKLLHLQRDDRLELLVVERLRLVEGGHKMEGVSLKELVSHARRALRGRVLCNTHSCWHWPALASDCF